MKPIHFFYFLLLISYQGWTNDQTKTRFDSLVCEIDRIGFSHGDRVILLLADLQKIADENPKNISFSIQYIYRETALSYAQGIHNDSLFAKINRALQSVNKKNYPFENALLNYSLALNYTTKGNYIDAFSNALQALELFKQLKNDVFTAKTYNVLGNICSYLRIGNMAEDYYQQGIDLVKPDQVDYYHLHNNLFRLMFFDQRSTAIIDSFLHFIPQIQAFRDTGSLVIAYLNLGSFYSTDGDYKQTYYYYTLAEKLLKSIDNKKLTLSFYQYMGIYYYRNNDYKKALQYFTTAKEIATRDRNLDQLSSSLTNLSSTYAILGDTIRAFIYLEKYNTLNHQIAGSSQAIKAYQSYVSSFLDASKNKLIIAEQEIKLKNRRLIFVLVISILIILLISLFLFIVQQQKRIKTSENRKLTQELEQEKEIQRLHDEKHAEILEAKIREITSYSLQLSNKNEILKQISDLAQQLPEHKKDVSEIRKKINGIVKNNLSTDSDWENFKLHFDKVHPRFFEKLKAACSGLTETNLRLCAYFRIGISNKQIAQILNISPESIIIHRYRLKKKLGLTEDQSLDDFIRGI